MFCHRPGVKLENKTPKRFNINIYGCLGNTVYTISPVMLLHAVNSPETDFSQFVKDSQVENFLAGNYVYVLR